MVVPQKQEAPLAEHGGTPTAQAAVPAGQSEAHRPSLVQTWLAGQTPAGAAVDVHVTVWPHSLTAVPQNRPMHGFLFGSGTHGGVVVEVVVLVVVLVVVVVGAAQAPLAREVPAGQRQRQWPFG